MLVFIPKLASYIPEGFLIAPGYPGMISEISHHLNRLWTWGNSTNHNTAQKGQDNPSSNLYFPL